jgi:hypothetical protein
LTIESNQVADLIIKNFNHSIIGSEMPVVANFTQRLDLSVPGNAFLRSHITVY